MNRHVPGMFRPCSLDEPPGNSDLRLRVRGTGLLMQ